MPNSHISHWFCVGYDGELFSKDTLKNLKRALKEGTLTYSVSTAFIQGEARVGKTCLKSLILSLPYDEVSTSCIEAPRIAYYGSTDGKVWNLVTDDEMDDSIIAELQQRAMAIAKKTTSEESPNTTREPLTTHSQVDIITPDINTSSMSPNPGHKLPQEIFFPTSHEESRTTLDAVGKSIDHQLNQPILIAETHQPAHNNSEITSKAETIKFDPLEFCKKKCKSHGFQHREWLHFFDSGGQIQFQKLLLAFMPCTTALIIVVNLSKDLLKPSSTSMQLENGWVIDTDEYCLNVEDMLKQLVSAVTFKFQSQIPDVPYIKMPKKENFHVISVGTHRDKLEESASHKAHEIEKNINETKKRLYNILFALKDKCHYNNEHAFHLYEVDGSKAKRGEFNDPSVKEISELLKEGAYEIKVPLRWHYFGVILRKKAKESKGILKKSSCERFGEILEMKPDEVHSVLRFFHALKMLFYYHDSPAKDIVFVKLDCLISIIKELVVDVLKSRNNPLIEYNMKELATTGYLSVTTLKSCKAFQEIAETIFDKNDDICSKTLLELFEFLKIGVKLDKSILTDDQSEEKFLMPALLPVKKASHLNLSNTIPLLFYFKNAVPMGLFCAVIVHLLSSGELRIISREDCCSNYFTFERDLSSFKVVFVEQLEGIKVYCYEKDERHEVKTIISEAIDKVMKAEKLNEKPMPGFYCPCNDQRVHAAKFVHVKEKRKVNIICTVNNDNQEISDSTEREQYWSWFMTPEEINDLKKKATKTEREQERNECKP